MDCVINPFACLRIAMKASTWLKEAHVTHTIILSCVSCAFLCICVSCVYQHPQTSFFSPSKLQSPKKEGKPPSSQSRNIDCNAMINDVRCVFAYVMRNRSHNNIGRGHSVDISSRSAYFSTCGFVNTDSPIYAQFSINQRSHNIAERGHIRECIFCHMWMWICRSVLCIICSILCKPFCHNIDTWVASIA